MSSLCNEAELEVVMRKMDSDRVSYEQKLERQAQLLDARAAKINKLEGIYSSTLTSAHVCTLNMKLHYNTAALYRRMGEWHYPILRITIMQPRLNP